MNPQRKDMLRDVGLLVLRVSTGLMMAFGHGFGKLMAFEQKSATFTDPLGVGSWMSMSLAVFAEFFCALAVATGTLTRLAAIPLVITMAVAAGIIHADDPWGRKELALLFLVPFATLVLTGPGRFSVDHLLAPLVERWRSKLKR